MLCLDCCSIFGIFNILVYVGVATVGSAAWWFMYYEGGPQVSWYQMVRAG